MVVKRMSALVGAGLVGAMLVLGACAAGGGTSDCEDGLDNDADGFVDDQDPGCALNGNAESPDPMLPACSDNVDNDGDGYVDWPQDPGCKDENGADEYNEPVPACRDGIDNDNDGLVDFPNDPGCRLDLENDEGDDCPDGQFCPKCSNGVDDDGDGLADYPDDPGCDRAADNDEFNADPGICGANVQVMPLPSMGVVSGTIQAGGSNELISQGCGGSGNEHVFTYTLPERSNLHISTNHPETTLDTVVYIRSACRDIGTELGCDDDSVSFKSELSVDAPAGMYFIVVDAHNSGSAGDYKLTVNTFIPRGEPCTPGVDTCAPGLVCRKLTDASPTTTCEKPECSDGLDNGDGDSLTDFPNDPGCTDANDNDESDDCPSGPNCPQCGNGSDDDDDGLVDYAGGDPGCQSAADTGEIDDCIPGVPVMALDPNGVTGTTMGASNFTGTCGFGTAPEDIYSYKLDRDDLNSITFSTVGSTLDTVTYVRFDDCASSSAQIACEDPGTGGEDVTISSPMAGTYFVFVDGDFGAGSYQLEARGEIPGFGACDPSDTQFVCELGYFCDVDTCTPAACNDGNDNDGDGKADYPADPGCDSPSDPTEDDNCPSGAGCPICSDGIDNDMDGKTDYPDDPGCNAASDTDETDCPGESDGVEVLTMATVTGDTTGLTNDFGPSCTATSTAPDKAYILPVSGKLSSLRLDTIGSTLDTVLYIKPSECSQPDLACNDEGDGPFGTSSIDLVDVDAGSYIIFVDGWSSGAGAYQLNVKGVIKAGEACDAAQVASGLMECEAGYACSGGMCVTAACNNGVDDGDSEDTLADYPNDPGCDSPSDNDESDTCPTDPTGPGCPACSNGLDDDGDGVMDYSSTGGGDPGCDAASDNNEIDECIAGVQVTLLDDAGASGTTPSGTTSNFVGSCHTSTTSTEDVYAYNVDRTLATVTFSTVGSTGDTVTHVRFGDCADSMTEVGCANTQNAGEAITVATPTQGWYYIFVDGDFISNISYVLNVSGTIANGDACDPMDTQFVCVSGHTCGSGNTCVPTECNDGADNDGDMKADALDPGCTSIDDDTEAPDPSPLPECADGVDNDGDGQADYPADSGCTNAADDMELNCDDMDPIGNITGPVTTGSTVGAADDFSPSCQSNSSAGDLVWILDVPGNLSNLDLDTIGSSFDTVMMIKQNLCTNPDYGCDDDYPLGIGPSEILLSNVPAGLYFVIVDGYSSNTGSVTLNVSGTIESGQPCDAAQVASGLFACATGTTCQDPGTGFVCQ